jgi:hypothetical protein
VLTERVVKLEIYSMETVSARVNRDLKARHVFEKGALIPGDSGIRRLDGGSAPRRYAIAGVGTLLTEPIGADPRKC